MFPIIIIVSWFIYQWYSLVDYFLSKNKKELFTNGGKYDTEVRLRFGIFLYVPPKILYMINPLTTIILFDQVSRHVFRENPKKISYYSRKLLCLKREQLSSLGTTYTDLRKFSMISLAMRHLMRILSIEDKNSDNHFLTSDLLKSQIEYIKHRTQYKVHSYEPSAEFANLINANNISVWRQHSAIKNDYVVWEQPPPEKFNNTWFIGFQNTEIAEYVKRKLYEFIPQQSVICLMVSGGIDSMTLARIFMSIVDREFRFIHINWKKRNESTIESKNLKEFFKCLGFGLEVIDSPIDPFSKKWDKLSTDFRFKTFHRIKEESSVPVYFCLGHIINDLLENLVCNSSLEGTTTGKQTYFDLFGMRELTSNSGLNIFRPLLLHKKPTDSTTPCLKDNAKDLIINRRVVRRLFDEFKFDTSRVRRVYYESTNICDKLRDLSDTVKIDPENNGYYRFEYDKSWCLIEWRQILSNLMNNLGYPNIRASAISYMMKKICSTREECKINMGKEFMYSRSFILKPPNCLLIPTKKETEHVSSLNRIR